MADIYETILRFKLEVLDETGNVVGTITDINKGLNEIKAKTEATTVVTKAELARQSIEWTKVRNENQAYIFTLQNTLSWLTRIGGTAMSISFSFFMLAQSVNETTIKSEKLTKVIKEANKWMTMFGGITQIITSILQILTFAKLQDARATELQNVATQRLIAAEVKATGATTAHGAALSAKQGAFTGGVAGAIVSAALFVAVVLPLIALAIGFFKNYDIGGVIRKTGFVYAKEGEEIITERERRFVSDNTQSGSIVIHNLNITTNQNNLEYILKDAQRLKNRGF